VLGDAAEAAELIRQTAKIPERTGKAIAVVARWTRPPWKEIVGATESILARLWEHICHRPVRIITATRRESSTDSPSNSPPGGPIIANYY